MFSIALPIAYCCRKQRIAEIQVRWQDRFLIVAFLVYRKLKIVGLLGYLLILFIAWISGGRDGLLWTNVFLFALIMGAYAIRGLFRNVRDFFDLASEAIGNRKGEEAIVTAGGTRPTAGRLEEETTTPKAVDQRDCERARPWLEMVPEDSRYKVSTWMPGSDSPIVESFFDRTLMVGKFLDLPEGTKVWI